MDGYCGGLHGDAVSYGDCIFPYPVSAKGILVQKLDEDALEKAWKITEMNFYRSSAVTKRGVCASPLQHPAHQAESAKRFLVL